MRALPGEVNPLYRALPNRLPPVASPGSLRQTNRAPVTSAQMFRSQVLRSRRTHATALPPAGWNSGTARPAAGLQAPSGFREPEAMVAA